MNKSLFIAYTLILLLLPCTASITALQGKKWNDLTITTPEKKSMLPERNIIYESQKAPEATTIKKRAVIEYATQEKLVNNQKKSEKITPKKESEQVKTLTEQQTYNEYTNSIDPAEIANYFEKKLTSAAKKRVNKILNSLAKYMVQKSFNLKPNVQLIQKSFNDICLSYLKKYLVQISLIYERIDMTSLQATINANALENFKTEISNLAQQINFYDNQNSFNNIDTTLDFFEKITKFLQTIDNKHISYAVEEQLTINFNQAVQCYHIFTNQPIIFSTMQTPQTIIQYFNDSFNNTENLMSLTSTYDILTALYNEKNGYTKQIIRTWNNFKNSPLYENSTNRSYAAFITFLLLFDDTLMAISSILNDFNNRYHAAQPIELHINLATPQPQTLDFGPSFISLQGNNQESQSNNFLEM